ncbi:MAG TPA: hypothetical protein VFW28_01215 [Micropepsaceae bacterium]|nr:hypothetical protein [Micropepsaceae bacterium]
MPGVLDPENRGAKFGSDAPITTGLLATVPASGLLAPPKAELRSYQPTSREWLHNQFTQFFGGGLRGASAADQAMALIGLTPLDAPLAAYDAGRTLAGGLFRSDLGDVARGAAGIGLAGLQAAVPGLLGEGNTLTKAPQLAKNEATRHLSSIILRNCRSGLSLLIIRLEHLPMSKETSPETSEDGRSEPSGWSVEKWWEETINRSRWSNMTPSQRRERANTLRQLRQGKWKGCLVLLQSRK